MDTLQTSTIAALSDCVSVIQIDQCKALRIQHDKASALISMHGGHLLSYRPTGEKDWVWMSDKAQFDGNTALRGGIPICFPWFGRIAAPAHGFARTSEWHLVDHRENQQGVIVELALEDSEATRQIWPHKFAASVVFEVTDTLKVTLKVENRDQHAWTFSGALHTYLNIGDINTMKVTGMGPIYLDSLQQGKTCHGEQTLALTDTIDRVYVEPETHVQLTDPTLGRILIVENEGHNSAVLWNPWSQGAESMADMQDDGYKTFFCIESTLHASSLEEGKELAPGETHALTTTLSQQPLTK